MYMHIYRERERVHCDSMYTCVCAIYRDVLGIEIEWSKICVTKPLFLGCFIFGGRDYSCISVVFQYVLKNDLHVHIEMHVGGPPLVL